MTCGPAINFPSIVRAVKARVFIESEDGYMVIKEVFKLMLRFTKLQKIKCALAGRMLFVWFATQTGDVMGMNMISKVTEKALDVLVMPRRPAETVCCWHTEKDVNGLGLEQCC